MIFHCYVSSPEGTLTLGGPLASMELYSHNGGLGPRQGGPVQGRQRCLAVGGFIRSDENLAKLYLAKFFTDLVGGLTVLLLAWKPTIVGIDDPNWRKLTIFWMGWNQLIIDELSYGTPTDEPGSYWGWPGELLKWGLKMVAAWSPKTYGIF